VGLITKRTVLALITAIATVSAQANISGSPSGKPQLTESPEREKYQVQKGIHEIKAQTCEGNISDRDAHGRRVGVGLNRLFDRQRDDGS
jgi:hypothetical protein